MGSLLSFLSDYGTWVTLNERDLGPLWFPVVSPQFALCCLIIMLCHFTDLGSIN